MSDQLENSPATPGREKTNFWRIGWLEAIMIVVICFIVYSVFAPSLLRPHGGDSRSSLISILKQLGLSALMYEGDYDERLPFVEPFEFGEDLLAPYIKNDEIHENPSMARAGNKRKPGTTQHEFRFAYAPLTLESKTWIRKIVDVRSTPKLETTPIVWSQVASNEQQVCILFADGHVKASLPETARTLCSPGFFGQTPFTGGRLNYIWKDAEWPPPTWSIPYSQIAEYIKQVKP